MVFALLEILAHLAHERRTAAVQLRRASGEPLGVVVVWEGRLCFARAHGRRGALRLPEPLRAPLRQLIANGGGGPALQELLARLGAPEAEALRSAWVGWLAEQLRAISEVSTDERLRARWRPLEGCFEPRLCLGALEVYLAAVEGVTPPPPNDAARFFEIARRRGDLALLLVGDPLADEGRYVPVRVHGFSDDDLWLVARLSALAARWVRQPALAATGTSPTRLSALCPDGAWVCVDGGEAICLTHFPAPPESGGEELAELAT